jgi:hypothetical protein
MRQQYVNKIQHFRQTFFVQGGFVHNVHDRGWRFGGEGKVEEESALALRQAVAPFLAGTAASLKDLD